MQRKNCATPRSLAEPMHTSMALTAPRSPDGAGPEGQPNRIEMKGTLRTSKPATLDVFVQNMPPAKGGERILILNEHSNCFLQFSRAANNGSDLRQHHPNTLHGCGSGSQFRAPRNSHGVSSGGLLPLAAVPSLRSARSRLAEQRSLRSVERGCAHAAL